MIVLHRMMKVLDAFTAGTEERLRLTEVCARTGLPKTTAFRLLESLDEVGLVEKVDGAYRLGMVLFELGEHVPRKRELREAALPFLEDLYETTHAIVHLAVLDGIDVIYVERLRGHHPLNVASRLGGRLPASCTGVGKALLAFDPEAAERALGQPLPARTPYTITDPRVLRDELERIRRSGVSYDREENAIGIVCAAAPILAHGRAVAAVSVTGRTSQLDPERIAPAVRTSALGIARALTG